MPFDPLEVAVIVLGAAVFMQGIRINRLRDDVASLHIRTRIMTSYVLESLEEDD